MTSKTSKTSSTDAAYALPMDTSSLKTWAEGFVPRMAAIAAAPKPECYADRSEQLFELWFDAPWNPKQQREFFEYAMTLPGYPEMAKSWNKLCIGGKFDGGANLPTTLEELAAMLAEAEE